ncbi:MAG TPA: ubiquitin-activating E1 FCCH domain-containing protein [Methylococcus sp.]|nr:ubiquitin-activating E1 FCCH domain-containing protein [Methylococcus sp.]
MSGLFAGTAKILAVQSHESLWHGRVNDIGVPGQAGYGVGICPPELLPMGMMPLPGCYSRGHKDYGNYRYQDGSIMCWIPAFYYRITAGTNNVTTRPIDAFPNVATANAEGFALHRAFYDGGVQQPGFFVDKYQWSANSYAGNVIASSIQNGNPLSSNSAHNGWGSLLTGLTTADNIHGGAIKAAKTRGPNFHCLSAFQWSALALLSLAHGQAAMSTWNCAWYDGAGIKNFPKGNNNNALGDVDDASVIYVGDGYQNSGKTGSGTPFAKTTHNGQDCGVADLNGNLWEVSLGLTCIAASTSITGATQANPCVITAPGHGRATGDKVLIAYVGGMTQLNNRLYQITVISPDTFSLDGVDSTSFGVYTSGGTVAAGTFYVAKQSVSMKNFTGGNSLATDHWGSAGVAANFDPISINFRTDYPNNAFEQKMGNGANQVLSEGVSGSEWLLTGLGFPMPNGMSVPGTNSFGLDRYLLSFVNEMCLLFGGSYTAGTIAGIWSIAAANTRTISSVQMGARSGLYL